MNEKQRKIVKATVTILVLLLSPLIIVPLWNWIIPDIMGFKEITYWQALVMMILFNLIRV